MVNSVESRLWLAVHLLYSNASQAFDVYQAVAMQSEQAIFTDDNAAVYAKLIQVFDKIPAISASLSFYEFEFEEIDQWKIIYKNSQKIQLLIFVGVLIFELKLSDIAILVKLPQEKVQFLFNQIFKKLASASQKLKYNEQLEFKKQGDNKISYLFTYENLVDYCLGQLSTEDSEKVASGLQNYPSLQVAKEEYARIIRQIQNLKVQKANSVSVRPKSGARKNKAGLEIVNEKTQGAVAAATATRTKKSFNIIIGVVVTITFAIIILQPMALVNKILKNDHSVVIHEVEKPATLIATHQSVPPPPPPAPAPVIVAHPAPVASPPPVAAAAAPEAAKSEGGLYRGTLVVANIETVNPKIIQKISSLGGVKAGEVEIGWLKTQKLAYYHYTIPQQNIDEVSAFLKQLGHLHLSFEKHPRKVAAGTKRFIIEVKQN